MSKLKTSVITTAKAPQLSADSEAALHLFRVLFKANRVLEQYSLRSTETLSICPSDFYILEALLHKGPMPMGVIAGKVLLTLGSLSVAVDRLEERGLVVRQALALDKRTKLIHLTKSGEKLVSAHFKGHAEELTAAMSGLNIQEQKKATQLIKKLGLSAAAKLQA